MIARGQSEGLPTPAIMYRALVQRDASFDGAFFACVRTTGIFCRPVCSARKPKRENVEFVATAREALHCGYRPCKLCAPLDVPGRHPDWVRLLLDRLAARPSERTTDADLRAMDIDPVAARRYFKRHFGVTYHAFQRSWRLGQAMKRLHDGEGVTSTALASGFDSESGFRDAFRRVFGENPADARASSCLCARWLTTPMGPMLAVASDDGLTLLEFVERRGLEREIEDIRRRFKSAIVPGDNAHLRQIEAEIAAYHEGTLDRFGVALDMPGSPFQRAVWGALLDIPHGARVTYAELATRLGRSGAARAVGRAVGQNRIAIVVPCHRVVGSDGSLTGYAGGLERKRALLEHERGAHGLFEEAGRLNRVGLGHARAL